MNADHDLNRCSGVVVSKALLISGATVILHAGGAIWLNPFATVLLNVCVVPSL